MKQWYHDGPNDLSALIHSVEWTEMIATEQTRQSIHGDENNVTSTGDPLRGTSGGRSGSLEPDKGTGYTARVRGSGDAAHQKSCHRVMKDDTVYGKLLLSTAIVLKEVQ